MKVKMQFNRNMFYDNPKVPIFLAHEIYELEGDAWINRWVKRGGVIIEERIKLPAKPKVEAKAPVVETEVVPVFEKAQDEVAKEPKKHFIGKRK